MTHQRSRLDELLDRKLSDMKTPKPQPQAKTVGKHLDNELDGIRKDVKKTAGLAYVMGMIQ